MTRWLVFYKHNLVRSRKNTYLCVNEITTDFNEMRQDIEKIKYEYALTQVEALLPLVEENTPANDPAAIELAIMSDYIIAYEKNNGY